MMPQDSVMWITDLLAASYEDAQDDTARIVPHSYITDACLATQSIRGFPDLPSPLNHHPMLRF